MENYSVTAGKFVCPADFTEVVNTEGLCLEDIDDSEIFIIQAPADVDLTKLHNQQLLLKNQSTFHYPGVDGQQESYICTTTAADRQLAKTCLVLPERTSLQLRAAEKHIKGVVYVEKRVAFPQIGYPKELCDRIKESENLKKQADSLSSGTSTILSDDYNKKRSSEDLAYLPRANGQSVKKKKHKRQLSQDSGPSEDIPLKNETKHKKNKSDQDRHIRAEEALSNGKCSEDDDSFGGAERKSKTSMYPKKKKKYHGDDVLHEAEESEFSEKMEEIELHEHSSYKPHKKKHTAIDTSSTGSQSVQNPQDHRKRNKTKHKSDKLKKLFSKDSHDNHSSSSSSSVYDINKEIENNATEANTYVKQPNETSFGEFSSSVEKRSKKEKKKTKVNSDDQSSSAHISHNELKGEINVNRTPNVNSSNRSQLSEIACGELSSSVEKRSKKEKKKKVNSGEQSSSAYPSHNELKEEISDTHMPDINSSARDQLNEIACGELSSSVKKRSKKEKKKVNSDEQSSSAYPSHNDLKEKISDNHMRDINSSTRDQPNEIAFGELSIGVEKRLNKEKKFHLIITSSHNEVKEEINDDHMLDVNNSARDQFNEIAFGELSSLPEKKSKKKKKKKDNSDDQSSSSYISSYEIKKEIDYDPGLEENSGHADCHSGVIYRDVPIDQKKKSKKKKKKDESVF